LVAGSSSSTANLSLALSGLPADAATLGFPASLSLPGSADFTVQTGPTLLGDFAFAVAGSAAVLIARVLSQWMQNEPTAGFVAARPAALEGSGAG
jgi:hypothetical protein